VFSAAMLNRMMVEFSHEFMVISTATPWLHIIIMFGKVLSNTWAYIHWQAWTVYGVQPTYMPGRIERRLYTHNTD